MSKIVPETSTSVLNLLKTVLNCQKLLDTIENILQSIRSIYKCPKATNNSFQLPEASKYY